MFSFSRVVDTNGILITLFLLNLKSYLATSEEIERGLFNLLFGPCRCRCGLPNRDARLVGGESLGDHEFPWMSTIHIKNLISRPGVLINDRYILTAASNILNTTPCDIKVTLGQLDKCQLDISSVNKSIERITMHQDFSTSTKTHNLALLKLSNPIILERRISPICLSIPGKTYLGQVATIVGESQQNLEYSNDTKACKSRKLGLPVLGLRECTLDLENVQLFSSDKSCAGVLGSPNVVCENDTGGPVMYRSHSGIYELIGILSHENKCQGTPGTAFYTKVNDHVDWITKNTRDACYCIKI